MDPLILNFLWKLLTGELYRLWVAHEATKKTQDVANAPTTKSELVDDFNNRSV